MSSLRDRSAIVTGASSGIGAATARMLAKAGLRVTLAARRLERLETLAQELRASGAQAVAVRADMRIEEDILGVFEAARTHFGGVDVLVNNAGLGFAAPIISGETEQWRTMLEVNVLGLCIASREAIRDMERRQVAGHVVQVSSMAAHRVPGLDSAVYSATKFAVRALTEGLRLELRARKSAIRISAVSPGYVETEFAQVFTGAAPSARDTPPPIKVLEDVDVAGAILWILQQPAHVQVHDVLLRPTDQRT